jgi:hypothetical protein
MVKFVATAATTAPTAKNNEDTITKFFLPKTWLNPTTTGWKTAEVSRNDVPAQKASMAVPLSFSVIMGRAILRDVASRAAADVTIQIEINAKRKPRPGLNGG